MCVAWVLLSVLPLQAGEIPIELKNPGFEDAGNVPPDWVGVFSSEAEGQGQKTSGTIKRDDTQTRFGEASAYLKSDGPRYARLEQKVNLDPGAKYRLTVWVRFVEQSKAGQISIWVRGRLEDRKMWDAEERLGAEAAAGEWNKVTLEFPVPENALPNATISARVLYSKGSIEAWFDDIELVQLSE